MQSVTASETGRNQGLEGRFGDLPTEEVPCYLCGSEANRILVDDPPFKVRLCSSCGLGYCSPRIAGHCVHQIYGNEYWQSECAGEYGYTCYEQDEPGYLRTFELRARHVARFVPRGRILEVGCAAGYFLHVMRKRGYDVHGHELSEDIARTARRRFGLPDVRTGLLSEAGFEEGTFDAVVMWDVVEHMADPVKELQLCRRLLKPEGRLVLQTQDVSSLARRLLGSRWHHFKQLEHIYHFDPSTVRRLLQSAGFEQQHFTRRYSGKYVSFDFIVERSRRLGGLPALLCRPLRLLGRRFLYVNPFDEMIVVARSRRPGDGSPANQNDPGS